MKVLGTTRGVMASKLGLGKSDDVGPIHRWIPFYRPSQQKIESECPKCIPYNIHARDSFSDLCFRAKGVQTETIRNWTSSSFGKDGS